MQKSKSFARLFDTVDQRVFLVFFFFLRLYLADFGKDNVELENLQWLWQTWKSILLWQQFQ